MKIFRGLFIFLVVLAISLYFFIDQLPLEYFEEKDANSPRLPEIKSSQQKKEFKILYDDDLVKFFKMDEEEIIAELGEPKRIDPSAYQYDWLIYQDKASYLQVGIKDGEVTTVAAVGEILNQKPFKFNRSYKALNEQFNFEKRLTYQQGLSFYSFILNDEDLKTNPLIQLENNLFIQLYFDNFTEKLIALRMMTGKQLLVQRFYEMEYRGSLPEKIELTKEEWEKVERGMSKQVFDLTNIFRKQYDVGKLKRNSQISEVAYLHSKDMYDNDYFSHENLKGHGLKERIEAKNIYYLAAAENIAAQHLDALSAMIGWINSEGHRETLFNDQYSHIGVGVYRLYYTQNFLTQADL